MSSDQPVRHGDSTDDRDSVRDIHALTPPRQPTAVADRSSQREPSWETNSLGFSNLSTTAGFSVDDYRAMSRELGALLLATPATAAAESVGNESNLARIGEEPEEINALAIVPDTAPVSGGSSMNNSVAEEVSVSSVKKEEIESKIAAWQTAEIAKANNKFKREDAIINGWESEEVQKANTWMKKVERKLEEKRLKAQEKMQNNVAKARRRAEEKRASAESKRGTKVAKVLELANVMRAVGKAPSKRSIF